MSLCAKVCFKRLGQWRNWRGGRGARRPPLTSQTWKMGPLLACISVFSILLIFSRFLFLAFFKNFSECFRVSVRANPVNRITNLPRFLVCASPDYAIICIRQISASLSPSDKGGPKISPLAAGSFFLGSLPKQGFNPKFKCETLEINVVFINSCSVLSCHL